MTNWEDWDPLAASIAAEYARKFRRWGAETEDVLQELRVWLYRHPRKLAEWEALDDEKATTKMVARTLRNEANRACQAQKASYLGYSLSDLAWFQRGELEVLLDAMFDADAWVEPPVADDGGRRGGDPATGGNWLATLADVSRAFDQLETSDKELLWAFHRDGYSNILLAEMRDVSSQAMSKQHQQSLNRLLELLGGERPRNTHETDCECGQPQYVGTRRAMSNAAARAAQESYYQE